MRKNSFPIKVVKRVRKGYSIDISRHIYDAIYLHDNTINTGHVFPFNDRCSLKD